MGAPFYQLASRSGVAEMWWIDRSAPSYSSSGDSRSPSSRLQRAVRPLRRPSAQATPITLRRPSCAQSVHTADAAQRLAAEDARPRCRPRCRSRPCSGQTPSTSSIFHLFCVSVNILTKMAPATPPTTSAPERVHQVGAGAHRHEARQRPVVDEAGVVPAHDASATSVPPTIAISELTATRPEILSMRLRAHHVEAEPAHAQHPRAQRQERNVRRRVRAQRAVAPVAVAARAQQQHRRQRQPAAHRMHHHRAGEVVELMAREPRPASPGCRRAGSRRCPRRAGRRSRR